MNKSNEDKLISFFYHLGKGLWKSVPILGPIIEEVIYIQFEDELKRRVSELDKNQVEEILRNIPQIDIYQLDNHLSQISEDLRLYNIDVMTNIISKLEESHIEFLDYIKQIETSVEPIPNILQLVNELKERSGDASAIMMALNELNEKRSNWIKRISTNQKKLLLSIPDEPSPIDNLWRITKEQIPDCGLKEFRFRLHELEWLGLVTRFWDKDFNSWVYELTSDAKQLSSCREVSKK
jgi:hypothetical protein